MISKRGKKKIQDSFTLDNEVDHKRLKLQDKKNKDTKQLYNEEVVEDIQLYNEEVVEDIQEDEYIGEFYLHPKFMNMWEIEKKRRNSIDCDNPSPDRQWEDFVPTIKGPPTQLMIYTHYNFLKHEYEQALSLQSHSRILTSDIQDQLHRSILQMNPLNHSEYLILSDLQKKAQASAENRSIRCKQAFDDVIEFGRLFGSGKGPEDEKKES